MKKVFNTEAIRHFWIDSKTFLFGQFWQILLIGMIIVSALAVPYQVYTYRKDTDFLQKLKHEKDLLDSEWAKLIIEQQTFGATTSIGSRATETLKMHPPKMTEIVTLSVAPELDYSAHPVTTELLTEETSLTSNVPQLNVAPSTAIVTNSSTQPFSITQPETP